MPRARRRLRHRALPRADQSIRFPLQLSGFQTNGTLQAWASLSGADCGTQNNRTTASAICWPLLTGIPLRTTAAVEIPVRAIMSGALDPKNPDTSDAICGKVGLTTVTVQFLYFAPGNTATPAANATEDIRVDTQGPPPLTGLTALPGDTRIRLSWTSVGEGGLVDQTGVKVYCDQAGGGSIADSAAPEPVLVCDDAAVSVPDDAGEGGAADLDAGCHYEEGEATGSTGSSGGGCSSAKLSPGVVPDDTFAPYLCGEQNGNTISSTIVSAINGKPLTNGVTYAVALAATDSFANIGELSTVVCDKPEETTDFWRDYREAGGQAGGGCSTSGSSLPIGSLTVIGLAGFATASVLRRRRRKKDR